MKKVILIITGSIAAPKALALFNLLKQTYQVTVIKTPSASKFVKFPADIKVYDNFLEQDFYQRDDNINHIEFATDHDLIVVYPATMNFISKAALAICDNLALATFLASKAKKLIFPAMNHNMYHNSAMKRNLELLAQDANVKISEVDYGLLATRILGDGRVKEPAVAMAMIEEYLKANNELTDKTILINYGATRAYVDDIRYLTNASSGQMGQALVNAFLAKNAKVIAVVGDISVPMVEHANLTIIKANTNQTILNEMNKYFANSDIVFSVAALNDYQMAEQIKGKIKKTENANLQLNLVPSIDVLATLGQIKTKQLLFGFSTQEQQDATIAQAKMAQKNCDGIIMNQLSVINQPETEAEFYFKNKSYHFKGSKIEVAKKIVQVISSNLVK